MCAACNAARLVMTLFPIVAVTVLDGPERRGGSVTIGACERARRSTRLRAPIVLASSLVAS